MTTVSGSIAMSAGSSKAASGGNIAIAAGNGGHLIGHVFPTPSKTSLDHLAFVGLPYNVVPFHLYELQSRWIGETILSKSKNQKSKNKNNKHITADTVQDKLKYNQEHRLLGLQEKSNL